MIHLYRLFYIVTAISLGTHALAGEDVNGETFQYDVESYCQSSPNCRKDVHVVLATDGGRIDTVLKVYWPAVGEQGISLLPGEELFVEAEIQGDSIGSFKQVSTIVNPGRTFIFQFEQQKNSDMILSVKNPFGVTVKYNIDLIDFQGNLHETSSCPVRPNGRMFEHWPYPIPEIQVTNFRVIEAGDSVGCVY